MDFLSWLANNPQEEESMCEQLSLWGESQSMQQRRRVDGATVRHNFTKTIQDKE